MSAETPFLVHEWADGCVVFDQQTGDTHALDPMSFAVFKAIQHGDNAPSAWQAACQLVHPASTPVELISLAQESYERLVQCGLIKPEKSISITS